MRAFSARKRALGTVIHGCLLWWFARKGPRCSRPDSNLRNAVHQVKLTLMIAAIGFSDDKRYAPAAALFRCAGPSWPLRAGGGSMRDLAAGPVDADQGTRGHARRHAAGEKRPAGRADEIRGRPRPARPRHPALGR